MTKAHDVSISIIPRTLSEACYVLVHVPDAKGSISDATPKVHRSKREQEAGLPYLNPVA